MGPLSVTIFWCSSMGPRSRWHFQQVAMAASWVGKLRSLPLTSGSGEQDRDSQHEATVSEATLWSEPLQYGG